MSRQCDNHIIRARRHGQIAGSQSRAIAWRTHGFLPASQSSLQIEQANSDAVRDQQTIGSEARGAEKRRAIDGRFLLLTNMQLRIHLHEVAIEPSFRDPLAPQRTPLRDVHKFFRGRCDVSLRWRWSGVETGIETILETGDIKCGFFQKYFLFGRQ